MKRGDELGRAPAVLPKRSPVSSFTWSPPVKVMPASETRAPPSRCCPADAPASRSAPTGSTNASTRLASAPDQPVRPPLFQLATELPAAILTRMLGTHIAVAVAWQRASIGDWMTYAAG
jgi:hypothetical protein